MGLIVAEYEHFYRKVQSLQKRIVPPCNLHRLYVLTVLFDINSYIDSQ